MSDRRYKLIGQGLPGPRSFNTADLTDGDIAVWNATTGRWDRSGETGTWDPVLQFGGATTGIIYSSQEGEYYRLGKMVYIFAVITLSSKGTSTGAATVRGLPFTVGDSLVGTSFEGMCNVPYVRNVTGTPGAVSATIADTEDVFMFVNSGDGTLSMDDGDFSDTTSFRLHGFYITDE